MITLVSTESGRTKGLFCPKVVALLVVCEKEGGDETFGFASLQETTPRQTHAGCVSSKIPRSVTDSISHYQKEDQRVCVDRM